MIVQLLKATVHAPFDESEVDGELQVTTLAWEQEQTWIVPVMNHGGQRMIRHTSEWVGLFGNDADARRAFAALMYRVIHQEPLMLPATVQVDDSLWNSGQYNTVAA